MPLVGELGDLGRAVPHRDAELVLEVGHRGADRRLHTAELARRRREASLLDDGDERTQLVERDRVEHGNDHLIVR